MRFKFWDRRSMMRTNNNKSKDRKSQLKMDLPSSDATAATAIPDTLADCFICLESMQPSDLAHPLMCSACHFNLCCKCLETIYSQPNCPNCRSSISATIGDTILLRKVDRDTAQQSDATMTTLDHNFNDDVDFEWRKIAMNEPSILKEIANARYREARFWSKQQEQQLDTYHKEVDEEEFRDPVEDEEEHGFEVDVRVGPHASIKLPIKNDDNDYFSDTHKTDVTLLAGLESVMTTHEQEDITRRLTSGDPNELAVAAAALSAVTTRVVDQKRVSLFDQEEDVNETTTLRKPLSIYELVQDGRRARRKQQQHHHTSPTMIPHKNKDKLQPYVKYYTQKRAHNRATDRQVQRECALLRQFPLPTRMPKVITIEPTTSTNQTSTTVSNTLQLIDSIWDGTVQDAYRGHETLHLQSSFPFHHPPPPVTNFTANNNNNNHHDQLYSLRIDTSRSRIVLATAGKQGERPGDVVTHVNGVPIMFHHSGRNAASLIQLLQSTTTTTTLTLNADLAVAHALKRRAMAMREYYRSRIKMLSS